MRNTTATLTVLTLAALLSTSALAGTDDPRVNGRQAKQSARIRQGARAGTLTPAEAKELRAATRDVRQAESAAKADGDLTRAERQGLRRQLNDVSRDIHQEKHDATIRPAAPLRAPTLNAQQGNQRARIRDGVQRGALTPAEAQSLRGQERAIREGERAARADGALTPQERAKLRTDLRATSSAIHAEKHDVDVTGP